jgi:hypothetical protein
MPSVQWREEFEAEFIVDGGGVFMGIDDAAKATMRYEPLDNMADRYAAGIDVGFSNDPTCFTVVDRILREQVYGESFAGMGTVRTIRRIVELLDIWNPSKTYIEKNGVGEHFVSLLRRFVSGGDISEIETIINDIAEDSADIAPIENEIGTHKIIAIHTNNENKRKDIERLAADIEWRRFRILKREYTYGAVQVSEMSTFERKPTDSGMSVRYEARNGCHDDTIAALALAYKSIKKMSRQDILGKINGGKKKRNPFRSKITGRSGWRR